MWSQKFSNSQDWVLLFVWHSTKSCCQTQGLPTATLSIQGNTSSVRTIRVRLPTGLIQLFSNPLYCPQIDTQALWNLYIVGSSMNVKQYSMSFPNFYWNKLHHGAAFLTDTASLYLDAQEIKPKTKHMQEFIIWNGNNLVIDTYTHLLFIFMYTHILASFFFMFPLRNKLVWFT